MKEEFIHQLAHDIAEEVDYVFNLQFYRGRSYANSPKHTLAIMIEEAIKRALKGDS